MDFQRVRCDHMTIVRSHVLSIISAIVRLGSRGVKRGVIFHEKTLIKSLIVTIA